MTLFGSTTRRAQLLGIGLLVGSFLIGMLAGAAVERGLHAWEADPDERVDRADRADGDLRFDRSREALYERLDLSPEQRRRVGAILDRRREEMRAFWAEHGPRVRGIVDSMRTDVRAVLSPAQREIEKRMWEERRMRFKVHKRKHETPEEERR